MQLICSAVAAACGIETCLHYSLDAEYVTGSARVDDLSTLQLKESKHFEALTGRMRTAGWTTREVLNLIAFFPFGRASESERFHAYWTRRLRDKSDTAGRPSLAEVTTVATCQHDLW